MFSCHPKRASRGRKLLLKDPASRAARSCSQSQEGNEEGVKTEVCGQEPLSHNPLALNRAHSLGVLMEKGLCWESRREGGNRKWYTWGQQAWLSVLLPSPCCPRVGSGKRLPLTSPGTPALRALPVHTGPGIRSL